jgi:hypothetical protein
VTIAKGRPWGHPGPLPADGCVVDDDAAAGLAVARARQSGTAVPILGLGGGDLCKTVGGRGEVGRLRSAEAVTFPIDIGVASADGVDHWFVAHVVARNRTWTRVVAAMNSSWLGEWNVAPRAHPNDGLLDVYDARPRIGELRKIRRRLLLGAHLPHPRIRERRTAAAEFVFDSPMTLWVDGRRLGRVQNLALRVEPDAALVVV